VQPPAIRLSLGDPFLRSILYQVLAVGAVGAVVWYLVSNLRANLAARKIASGFGFLDREAGFGILQTLIDYAPAARISMRLWPACSTRCWWQWSASFSRPFSDAGRIGRLSRNWLIARLCSGYVESLRNVPLAVQLFFWYAIVKDNLPSVRQAFNPLPGVYLSQRGLVVPVPKADPAYMMMMVALLIAIVAAWHWRAGRGVARPRPGDRSLFSPAPLRSSSVCRCLSSWPRARRWPSTCRSCVASTSAAASR